MEQTIEELLAQKPPVLLRAGHVSIRQLAEKLRTAMKDASRGGKDTQAVQYVFGLPFVKSLKLWTQAVCKCPALKSLLHPLVILILSAIRAKECHLIFMPYVSILLGLINDLSLECAVFIPISSSSLAALTLCANKLASKSLTAEGREPNITDVVRVSERQLKDKRVVSGLTSLLKIQLMRHVAFLARTAALPEIGWVILQALRKVAKSNPDTKQELSSLISGLDKSIVEVREKRKSGQEELFQFEFQDTSVGKLIQHSLTERKTYYPKTEEEDLEVSSDDEEKDDEEEEEEQDKTRSKRSLKRERQKEKKRRLIEMSADTVIERVERKLVKIESEVVPFALSDDEEEGQESK
jgi:hypothetical protein